MEQRTWQEADIKAGVQNGGSIQDVFIICREDERGKGHIAYIRATWARGFRPMRTYRDPSDRVFRDLDKLVSLIRSDFAYRGEISLFVSGDKELARYRALLPTDRDALGVGTAEHTLANGNAVLVPAAEEQQAVAHLEPEPAISRRTKKQRVTEAE